MRGAVGTGLVVALLAAGVRMAGAAPATPEEAQRLTELLERYVGHPAGARSAVSVVPHGEGYTASLDITQLFAPLGAAGLSVTAGLLGAELTPNADGTWRVTIDGFPPVGVVLEGRTTSVVLNGYSFEGTFDPAIRWFATARTRGSGTTTRATGPEGTTETRVTEQSTGTSTARAAGPDAVDMTADSTNKDLRYAATLPAGVPGQAVAATAEAVTSKVALDGLRVAALQELWAFLVAHHGKDELAANQAELKARLTALVPLARGVTLDAQGAKVAIDTALGRFTVDSLSEHLTDAGTEAGNGVALRLGYAGLALPEGLVPPWAVPLLPSSLDLGSAYGPVDLKPAAQMAIGALDVSADKPFTDAQGEAILATLRAGDPVVTLAPSTIGTPTLALKMEGTLHPLAQPSPSGSATIRATGLDKAIGAVRAAAGDDPTAAQAVAVLLAAKATGSAEGPDAYLWRIEGTTDGKLTVNGLDLAALGAQMSGPPPAQPPAPHAPPPKPGKPKAHKPAP